MSNNDNADDFDKPLDPVMENLRRKMVRLQLVSASVMVISLMAVLGAIVYKASTTKPAPTTIAAAIPSDSPLVATANLPKGFTITSVSLSGNQILFYGKTAESISKALVFDSSAGRMIADITIAGQ